MSKGNYTIKPTKKQKAIIINYIKKFHKLNNDFYNKLHDLEGRMSVETGIEGLEFIHDTMCMGWLGVGMFPPEMELIDIWEYEDE